MIRNDVFEPALHSNEELLFFADHLGVPPIAALHKPLPAGVNPAEVSNVLGRIYELSELEKHQQVAWAGLQAIKDAIIRYLEWTERSVAIQKRLRGRIGHPSMYVWDTDGRAHRGGIGADCEIVRTEILPDGSRRPFAVNLLWPDGANPLSDDISDLAPWVVRAKLEGTVAKDEKIIVKEDKKGRFGTLECPICGKAEEFRLDDKGTYRAARMRIGRHLKTSRIENTRHQLLYTKMFS